MSKLNRITQAKLPNSMFEIKRSQRRLFCQRGKESAARWAKGSLKKGEQPDESQAALITGAERKADSEAVGLIRGRVVEP